MATFANQLFDFYPPQEIGNPETFLAGVIELFEHYAAPIVATAVSPVYGIPAKHKFIPRIAEIKETLDEIAAAHSTRARYQAMPKPTRYERIVDRSPGRRANVCVHRDAPQYATMVERTQSPHADPADWKMDEGGNLWVSLAWFDVIGIGKWTRPKFRPDNDAKIKSEEMRDDEITTEEQIHGT